VGSGGRRLGDGFCGRLGFLLTGLILPGHWSLSLIMCSTTYHADIRNPQEPRDFLE
jgi:hypothetical protein